MSRPAGGIPAVTAEAAAEPLGAQDPHAPTSSSPWPAPKGPASSGPSPPSWPTAASTSWSISSSMTTSAGTSSCARPSPAGARTPVTEPVQTRFRRSQRPGFHRGEAHGRLRGNGREFGMDFTFHDGRPAAAAGHGLQVRPLPERPDLPLAGRQPGCGDRRRGFQPRGPARHGRSRRAAVHPCSGDRRHQTGSRGAAAGTRGRVRRRPGGPGALHAGAVQRSVHQPARPGDQHPPFLPARASRAPSRTTRRTTAG